MLKLFVLILILLTLVLCGTLKTEENMCDIEAKRWEQCQQEYDKRYAEYFKPNSTSSEEQNQELERKEDIKKKIDCIGDLKCKGRLKYEKFQMDVVFFIGRDDVGMIAGKCIKKAGQEEAQRKCHFFVPCIKGVLERTNCSMETKMDYVKKIHAFADFIKYIEWTMEEENMNNFDVIFDETKYEY